MKLSTVFIFASIVFGLTVSSQPHTSNRKNFGVKQWSQTCNNLCHLMSIMEKSAPISRLANNNYQKLSSSYDNQVCNCQSGNEYFNFADNCDSLCEHILDDSEIGILDSYGCMCRSYGFKKVEVEGPGFKETKAGQDEGSSGARIIFSFFGFWN